MYWSAIVMVAAMKMGIVFVCKCQVFFIDGMDTGNRMILCPGIGRIFDRKKKKKMTIVMLAGQMVMLEMRKTTTHALLYV